jgi:uncharacterized membrane protein YfcA
MISWFIPILFLIIATLYSSIGFGGGSSYIALLLLTKTPIELVPLIALFCNLIVVSGSSYHYIKKNLVNWRFFSSLIITSIPFAFLGGGLEIDERTLKLVLGSCLLIAGVRMLFLNKLTDFQTRIPPIWTLPLIGSILGFVSGLVGIGGGIFLSPILYNLRLERPKNISAICCMFIFVNSIAGLIGQLSKQETLYPIVSYWPLALVVLIGGQVGSIMGVNILSPKKVKLITAILVIFVSIKILFF